MPSLITSCIPSKQVVALKLIQQYKECQMDLEELLCIRNLNLKWETFQVEANTRR